MKRSVKSEAKGGLLSRERRPPFESPKRTAGAFQSHGRGPAPPFWIILPALLTARHCCARTQSAARLPSLAPHGVRRGCWMNRLAGTRGEATYTALTLRSACSHSSCKLPMLGVEGDSPRVLLGVQGGYSLTRENLPLCPVQRHRRCHPSRTEHGIFFLNFSKKVKENKK